MPRKIKLLVAVHLALGMAPALAFLVPPEYFRIGFVVLAGVSFGQWMLLAFWTGLGTSSSATRLIGSILGVLSLAVFPAVGIALSANPTATEPVGFVFALYLAVCAATVMMFSGIFLLIRRGFAELRHVAAPAAVAATRYQFSIMQLLLATSAVAVVLGLLRWSSSDNAAMWHALATSIVTLVALVTNVLSAPWAVLSSGRVRRRLFVVLLTTIALGFTMSYSVLWGLETSQRLPRLFGIQALVAALSSAVVVLSLLVVRACGYRLVRKANPLAPRAALDR